MEALIFFVFFALYILIRVLLGGGRSNWEKQCRLHEAGVQLMAVKNYASAKEYFETAVLQRPHDALNYVMLGQIALHKDEPERALFFGSKALRLDNSIWQAHILMSRAFYKLGDYSGALLNGRNAVWFGRDVSETYQWYGKLLLESGEVEKGLEMMADSSRLGEEKATLSLLKRSFTQKRN